MIVPPPPPIEAPLVRALLAGEFAVTAEIIPPVTGTPEALLEMAEPLRGWVDAINITDGPRGRVHMSGLAAAAILVAHGIDPVLQFTCRDRNRIALQSDLLGASALGIRNILILRGDDPDPNEVPVPKAVFDLDSRELIHLATKMRDGTALPSGREMIAPPRFFIGAADTPIDPAPGWQPTSLRQKVDAGAQFVQTQICFDIDVVRRYVAGLKDNALTDRVHILIGLAPLASARSAYWMRENLHGVEVPDHIIERLKKAGDAMAEGIRICAELIEQLQQIDGVSGAHLMAPGNIGSVSGAIQAAGLKRQRWSSDAAQ